jgi:hypothetical protein
MNAIIKSVAISLVTLATSGFMALANAQVPIDDNGRAMADYEPLGDVVDSGGEEIPLLTPTELQDLVGPVALYPDDLLAIVLPASTYPLQLVQAQRFLQALEEDPSLSPDDEWDDSVIALLNYPEVIDLLNEDLDWTWRLGEAVVAQQADVVTAVESFRDRAYAAGNLKSDSRQRVRHSEGAIEITPAEDDIIYVPYYEPTEVVAYQSRPVYYYYPRAYPVYYYPYPDSYAFRSGYFWGVTTAFTVGWLTDRVHVVHHSYHGHPYYGRRYWDGWWYRRPTVHVHNNYYGSTRYSTYHHRYTRGDYWRPRYESRRRMSKQRITRSTYYADRDRRRSTVSNISAASTSSRQDATRSHRRSNVVTNSTERRSTRPTTRTRAPNATQQRRPEVRNVRSQRVARQDGARSRDDRDARAARRHVARTDSNSARHRQQTPRGADVRHNAESRSTQTVRTSERRTAQRREATRPREHSNRQSTQDSRANRRESRDDRGDRSKSKSSRRQRH